LLLGAAAGMTLAVAAPAATAQIADLNDAIDKAGRQRMLSQRMLKCYMAMGQGVLPDEAARVLAASMAQFDRALVELKAFAPSPALRGTYTQLEAAWSEYKGALVGARPARTLAAGVLQQAERVLPLAHQGTAQLESAAGKPLGRLVNLSGRQRMLSQRMAAYFLAGRWGLAPQAAATEVGKARTEFVGAMKTLAEAPETTAAIRAELDLAEQQWVFFDHVLRSPTAAAHSAPDAFTASERILQVMDKVTALYAKA
jgi:hypothetical protein